MYEQSIKRCAFFKENNLLKKNRSKSDKIYKSREMRAVVGHNGRKRFLLQKILCLDKMQLFQLLFVYQKAEQTSISYSGKINNT